jgi:hypothetical protein
MDSDEQSMTVGGNGAQVRVRQVRPPDETVTFTASDPVDIFVAAAQWLTERTGRSSGSAWNISYVDYDYGPRPIFSRGGAVKHRRVEYCLALHIERFPDPLA